MFGPYDLSTIIHTCHRFFSTNFNHNGTFIVTNYNPVRTKQPPPKMCQIEKCQKKNSRINGTELARASKFNVLSLPWESNTVLPWKSNTVLKHKNSFSRNFQPLRICQSDNLGMTADPSGFYYLVSIPWTPHVKLLTEQTQESTSHVNISLQL